MKKMNIVFAVIGLIISSCSVHERSFQNNQSMVVVDLIDEQDISKEQKAVPAVLGGIIVTELLNIGFDRLVGLLNKETAKYSASYGAVLKQDGFDIEKDNTILVKRTLDHGEKKAMELKIGIKNNSNYFNLVPKSLLFNYSKAKVTEKSCVCKKINESKVLITVTITIMAAWEDKMGEKHLEKLTVTNFGFIQNLRNENNSEGVVKLDKVVESDIIKPIPKMSYKNGNEDPKGVVLQIKADVNEIDGCENEVVKLMKVLKDNKDDIVGGIVDLTKLKDE
ncbi:hypothetical protein [Wenyingzhuangia sp. IMCC45467]